nr:MAG TPA: hypothetical protein [Bacteriophage sp.]
MFVQLSTLLPSQHHYVHLYLSTKHRPYHNLYCFLNKDLHYFHYQPLIVYSLSGWSLNVLFRASLLIVHY